MRLPTRIVMALIGDVVAQCGDSLAEHRAAFDQYRVEAVAQARHGVTVAVSALERLAHGGVARESLPRVGVGDGHVDHDERVRVASLTTPLRCAAP